MQFGKEDSNKLTLGLEHAVVLLLIFTHSSIQLGSTTFGVHIFLGALDTQTLSRSCSCGGLMYIWKRCGVGYFSTSHERQPSCLSIAAIYPRASSTALTFFPMSARFPVLCRRSRQRLYCGNKSATGRTVIILHSRRAFQNDFRTRILKKKSPHTIYSHSNRLYRRERDRCRTRIRHLFRRRSAVVDDRSCGGGVKRNPRNYLDERARLRAASLRDTHKRESSSSACYELSS